MYLICRLLVVVIALGVASSTRPALSGPADDQYTIATKHYSQKRWKLACDEFATFLSEHPNHRHSPSATFYYAESLVQVRDWDRAEKQLDRFLANNSTHELSANALFRRGEVAFLKNDDLNAERFLKSFQRKNPRHKLNAFVLPYLGEIALRQDKLRVAEKAFTDALSQHPRSPLVTQCRLGLGRAFERSGNKQSALRFYQFVVNDSGNPLADDALLEMGALLVNSDRHAAGRKALDQLIDEYPESPLRPHAHYWAAMAMKGQEQWRGAVDRLSKALTDHPDHHLAPAMAFTCAECLIQDGDTAGASEYYKRITAKWSQSPWGDDSLHAQIQLALEQGELQEVEAQSLRFAKQYKDSALSPAIKQLLGRSFLKRKRYDRAADIFVELVGRDTENRDAANRYYLALAKLGQDRHDDAVQLLDMVLESDISAALRGGALSARATALIKMKRFSDAADTLSEYLEDNSSADDAARCSSHLVVALTNTERYNEAFEALERLRVTHPESPEILPAAKHFAETCFNAGRKQIALEAYQQLASEQNSPDQVLEGLFGLGIIELQQDPESAAGRFERIVQLHPTSERSGRARMLWAKALENAGQKNKALSVLEALIDRRSPDDNTVIAKHNAARLHLDQEQPDEAIELLRDIAREHPAYEQLDAVLYQLAWTLSDRSRDDEADAVFEQLVEHRSDSPYLGHAQYRLAERAAQRHNYPRARVLLNELLATNCDGRILCHSLYLRGQVEANSGNWDDSIGPMKRLLDNFPESELATAARYWVAEARFRLGERKQAARLFELLHGQMPDDPPTWMAMIPLRRAQIYAHQKRWSEAYLLAVAVRDDFPGFGQRYEVDYLLGRCFSSKANFSSARNAYQSVTSSTNGGRTETAAMAQWMIGETYFQQKNYFSAIKAYHRVEALYPFPRWQAAALLQAGKCHELNGNRLEAARLYTQLIDEYADTKFVSEANSRLRILEEGGSRQ